MSHNSVTSDVNLLKLQGMIPPPSPHLVNKIALRLWFYCLVGIDLAPRLTQQSDFSIVFPTEMSIPVSHILIELLSLFSVFFISELNKILSCTHYLF